MNIGIDATALYGRYGGVEYALWNLLCALAAVDDTNRYTVYIPSDGPPAAHLWRFGPRWKWVRLPQAGAHKAARILWQQAHLPRRLLQDGCAILHAPTYVAPLLAPVPVVLTVYDLIALTHPEFATRPNRWHYAVMLKRSISGAHRVIVPSETVARELSRRVPVAASRTQVIPLGVEPLFTREHDEAAFAPVRARYRLPPRFLLFVGNFEPKKNLRNLMRALDLLRDAPPLVVVGGARPWIGYEIGDSAAAPPAATAGTPVDAAAVVEPIPAPRMLALGYVRREDLPLIYAMCEAFVFPSLAEGFGLPVLEALASGAPVVTSDAVALPRLETVALMSDPTRPASIAMQIERVLQDPVLSDDLRRRARDYARPFTWRHTAEMTLAVYRSLQP